MKNHPATDTALNEAEVRDMINHLQDLEYDGTTREFAEHYVKLRADAFNLAAKLATARENLKHQSKQLHDYYTERATHLEVIARQANDLARLTARGAEFEPSWPVDHGAEDFGVGKG